MVAANSRSHLPAIAEAAGARPPHIAPVRNGLVIRSWPMLEPGPWPQMKPTSSPSAAAVGNRLDQCGVIAAGNVAAPDRAR